MIPSLYGAMPRVFAAALLLLMISAAAFSAHAEVSRVGSWHRPHRHVGGIDFERHIGGDLQSVAPALTEISVFGRDVAMGAKSAGDEAHRDLASSNSNPPFAKGSVFWRRPIAEIVRTKALALGVPVPLALAITRHESGGNCAMRGRAGERGAMQVLPQTARSVGVAGDLDDCATGIEAGLRYLRIAIAMHARSGWCAVASAYNSGTWHGPRCTHYGRVIALAAGMR